MSTASADKQTRELLVSTLAWVAKWESQRKSQRLKAKVQSKRAKAEQLGQRALWGRGKLATDRDAAQVRDLRAAGKSVRRIAAETGLSKSQVQRLLAAAA